MSNKKKVMLCDCSSDIFGRIAQDLQKYNSEIVYWTGCKHEFSKISEDKESFPSTIFHDTYDAIRGLPAPGVNTENFTAPSVELIEQMLECESIALSMMDRMDFNKMALARKKSLYYAYLEYWSGVLLNLRPDVIIFSKVPHAVYNFVILSLANKFNIPTVMYTTTRFHENLLLTDNYKEASKDLQREYERIKNEPRRIEDLPSSWKEDFYHLLGSSDAAIPYLTKKRLREIKKPLRLLPSFRGAIKSISQGAFLKTSKSYLNSLTNTNTKQIVNNIDKDDLTNYKSRIYLKKIQKIKDEYKEEYSDLEDNINLENNDEKFVYVALHYQPEMITSPLGGVFNNQILLVKLISQSIPNDWYVYVRENIIQWAQDDNKAHMLRYKGYYEELKSMKNVRLVSPSLPTLKITDKAQAVATVSGTACWEALVKGKPALFFGYPWYMYCEGAFKISDVPSCKAAIDKISAGYKPELQKIINYAEAVERTVVKGTWEDFQSWNKFTREESYNNLKKSLFEHFNRIGIL